MGKLTDVAIRAWIRSGERFEGRSDGDGLVLTWREKRTAPSWRLRYRFSGKPRVMEIGSYSDLTLAAARQAAKELRAKIALGHDVAGEKQERKSTALARIEAARSVTTVGQLADEYFERMINGRWKHPNIVRSRIEKDIKPHLGKLALDAVEPRHIDAMLRAVVKRGAPTIANDVLRWVRRMFDYAIKRHLVRFNPAAAFDLADAGGKELARERALSRDELVTLFEAMRQAKGFSVQNELTVKLLLLLAVRKGELIAARWEEFKLEAKKEKEQHAAQEGSLSTTLLQREEELRLLRTENECLKERIVEFEAYINELTYDCEEKVEHVQKEKKCQLRILKNEIDALRESNCNSWLT